jgi:hypothetical protein
MFAQEHAEQPGPHDERSTAEPKADESTAA